MITAERLRQVLSYDPETGVFLWKEKIARKVVVGRKAGNIGNFGYIYIRIAGKLYYGHRLAWLYVHGVWPEKGIDHRNGVPDDNRIANLRPANQSENNQNMRLPKHNKSGFMGVSFFKSPG